MKYIRSFETLAGFQAAQATLDTPNVSLIEATMGLNYLPYVAPASQHEYVEIGGIKWATMNLGANSITDLGLYYQWGDTQGYTPEQIGWGEGLKYFDWDHYIYYQSNQNNNLNFTKYNSTDELTTLVPEDDAVHVMWGGNWRMPTSIEYQILQQSVNTEYTSNYQGSGIAGLICIDKTDNTKILFFPLTGYITSNTINSINNGYYWSSSIKINNFGTSLAYDFVFNNNGNIWWNGDSSRYQGCQIRGILDESNS